MPRTVTRKEAAQTAARNELRDLFATPGVPPVVYVVQRHVSASGMQRQLDLYALMPAWRTYNGTEYPDLRRITHQVAQAAGYSYSRRYDALTINGCGMNMHFDAVYNLSAALYGHDERGGYRLTHATL